MVSKLPQRLSPAILDNGTYNLSVTTTESCLSSNDEVLFIDWQQLIILLMAQNLRVYPGFLRDVFSLGWATTPTGSLPFTWGPSAIRGLSSSALIRISSYTNFRAGRADVEWILLLRLVLADATFVVDWLPRPASMLRSK